MLAKVTYICWFVCVCICWFVPIGLYECLCLLVCHIVNVCVCWFVTLWMFVFVGLSHCECLCLLVCHIVNVCVSHIVIVCVYWFVTLCMFAFVGMYGFVYVVLFVCLHQICMCLCIWADCLSARICSDVIKKVIKGIVHKNVKVVRHYMSLCLIIVGSFSKIGRYLTLDLALKYIPMNVWPDGCYWDLSHYNTLFLSLKVRTVP